MFLSIAAILTIPGAILLLALFGPERRKQYNEFHRPITAASGAAVYGDIGATTGVGVGGMIGSCGGDSGGGGSC